MAQAVKGGQARRGDQPAEAISPLDQLQSSLQELAGTVTERAMSSLSDRITGATERLSDYVESGGEGGLLAAVTGIDRLSGGQSPIRSALAAGAAGASGKVKETLRGAAGSLRSGKDGGGAKKSKVTNIVEQIDIGVPVDLAYKQWTQFAEFPKFLSRRTWEPTITEQVPNERIVWQSKGEKGYVDGAVTFHELAPDLTRVIVVLEYYPKGMFERTGNLWRAQGRRARLELKNFQRQLMTQAVLHPDEVRGWQGEIREGRVAKDDEEKRRPEGGQKRRTHEEIEVSGSKRRQAPERGDSPPPRAVRKERSRA